jgi:hypothetical protein
VFLVGEFKASAGLMKSGLILTKKAGFVYNLHDFGSQCHMLGQTSLDVEG